MKPPGGGWSRCSRRVVYTMPMEGRDWLEIAVAFAVIVGLIYFFRLMLPGVPGFIMVLPVAMLYIWLRQRRE